MGFSFSHISLLLFQILEEERILLLQDEDDLGSEGGLLSIGGGLEQMVHDIVELPEQRLVLLHVPQKPVLVFHVEVLSRAPV